ncbi:glycoside hydrolase family 3 protein [Weeksellaceae bacterium TAE3-ERU29]|nr:glycoside hydrolase family 3 protein [Weeksellaceae bacterium TAE3-ERU29]
MYRKSIIFIFSLINTLIFAQQDSPLYLNEKQMAWVDSVYNSMSLNEKVGQLFMIAAYSNKDKTHENQIEYLIKKEKIGGLIFMQDNAEKQVKLINHYQEISKVPLLIGMDAEWDVSMRLKDTNRFPWAMTMGALQKNDLIYETGEKIAEHLHLVGAHFNFAPDIDVNVNPNNPIIGNRSFGSDAQKVAEKGLCYMQGMQDNQVLSSAKHFPGHGDTDQDSHKTLPTITHSKERLNKVELAPFKTLIDNGVTAIMVAHLNVPAYEKDPKKPASLSKNIVTNLLKKELGFKGIIITDALNMSGVTKNYPNGESDYIAFEAGNDILLFSQAVNKGKQKIIDAIKSKKISEKRLEESVKKILMAKYYAGLNNLEPKTTKSLIENLNDEASKDLTFKIFANAVTLLKNENNLLPIDDLANNKLAWLPLEEGEHQALKESFGKYTNVDLIDENKIPNLDKYNTIFITIHKSNETPYKSYEISEKSKKIIQDLSEKHNVVLVIFGSPYALKDLDTKNIKSLIVAYQNHEDAQDATAGIIFGNLEAHGRLPVDVAEYKSGDGVSTRVYK